MPPEVRRATRWAADAYPAVPALLGLLDAAWRDPGAIPVERRRQLGGRGKDRTYYTKILYTVYYTSTKPGCSIIAVRCWQYSLFSIADELLNGVLPLERVSTYNTFRISLPLPLLCICLFCNL